MHGFGLDRMKRTNSMYLWNENGELGDQSIELTAL